MREYFIAGNWKMNMLTDEARSFVQELRKAVQNCKHKLLIAAPYTALSTVAECAQGSNVLVAAQNVSHAASGAYTGEVSVEMLRDIGVGYSIVGHSERRTLYGETNADINAKIKNACAKNFNIIFCLGESLEEREAGKLEEVISEQITQGLDSLREEDLSGITIAYEPVWAIGTGKTASPEDADAAHAYIRSLISNLYSPASAERMIIQYGGSVKPENVQSLMSMPNIDGALVGGASLKLDSFLDILAFDRS